MSYLMFLLEPIFPARERTIVSVNPLGFGVIPLSASHSSAESPVPQNPSDLMVIPPPKAGAAKYCGPIVTCNCTGCGSVVHMRTYCKRANCTNPACQRARQNRQMKRAMRALVHSNPADLRMVTLTCIDHKQEYFTKEIRTKINTAVRDLMALFKVKKYVKAIEPKFMVTSGLVHYHLHIIAEGGLGCGGNRRSQKNEWRELQKTWVRSLRAIEPGLGPEDPSDNNLSIKLIRARDGSVLPLHLVMRYITKYITKHNRTEAHNLETPLLNVYIPRMRMIEGVCPKEEKGDYEIEFNLTEKMYCSELLLSLPAAKTQLIHQQTIREIPEVAIQAMTPALFPDLAKWKRHRAGAREIRAEVEQSGKTLLNVKRWVCPDPPMFTKQYTRYDSQGVKHIEKAQFQTLNNSSYKLAGIVPVEHRVVQKVATDLSLTSYCVCGGHLLTHVYSDQQKEVWVGIVKRSALPKPKKKKWVSQWVPFEGSEGGYWTEELQPNPG